MKIVQMSKYLSRHQVDGQASAKGDLKIAINEVSSLHLQGAPNYNSGRLYRKRG